MRSSPARSLLLFMLLAACSCSGTKSPPTDAVPSAYADLLLLRSMSGSLDSTRYALAVDSVLASHGLDRASFEAGMIGIGGTPAEVTAFFDRVNARLAPPPDSVEER